MAKDRERPRPPRTWTKLVLLALAASLAIWLAGCGGDAPADDAGPLRLGLLVNLSEGAPARAVERQRAFEMAVQHVNAAGGVFGQPVQFVVGDSTLDPEKAVAEARRLVEDEGVHAIVGPTSSANALAVAERVSGPSSIPTVSPSATSPALALVNDGDFFFRTTLSDGAQGPVLARVAREQGFENVGVLYRNDAYGLGLFESFRDAWTGAIAPVAVEGGQASYLPELRRSAEGGASALVALTFESEGAVILREAIDSGLYTRFAFGDALKSPDLVQAIGGDWLGGMYGTAGASDPGNPSAASWDAAYATEYGAPPAFAYTRETYDAAIALALAAQAANSVDGAAIRDQLRAVGSAPGDKIVPGADSIADGLRILADGGEVDYDGAAATLDWDGNGELRFGHIGVWRFTVDGGIEEVEVVAFDQRGE